MIHFSLAFGGFLAFNLVAAGAADAGAAAGGPLITSLARVVNYLLLQPFAYWVIAGAGLVWWTWGGLFLVACVVALNSCAVSWLLHGVLRVFSARVP